MAIVLSIVSTCLLNNAFRSFVEESFAHHGLVRRVGKPVLDIDRHVVLLYNHWFLIVFFFLLFHIQVTREPMGSSSDQAAPITTPESETEVVYELTSVVKKRKKKMRKHKYKKWRKKMRSLFRKIGK